MVSRSPPCAASCVVAAGPVGCLPVEANDDPVDEYGTSGVGGDCFVADSCSPRVRALPPGDGGAESSLADDWLSKAWASSGSTGESMHNSFSLSCVDAALAGRT